MSLIRRRRATDGWTGADPAAQQGYGPGDPGLQSAAGAQPGYAPPSGAASAAGAVSGRRRAGLGAIGTMASGVVTLARLVMTAAALIALLIGLAILLRDVGANPHNTIVKGLHDGANFFAGSFTGLVTFNGHPKRAIAVNWGIALLCYLAAGALVAAIIARFGRHGLAWERSHSARPVT